MIHFICALKCEASAIIEHYALKHMHKANIFNIYVNDRQDISLTISGIGKLAAAAASTYSYSTLKCARDDVWLNLGIAGHRSHNIGEIYMANRIEDAGSTNVWYPQVVIDTDIPGLGLLTLDQPSTDYHDAMFDMEAAGFISSAARFATAELTHSIKIISDNQAMPAGKMSADSVTALIKMHKDKIVTVASQLNALSIDLRSEIDITDDFQQFVQQWHFTKYQQNTLKQLLHRWHILLPDSAPLKSISGASTNARTVLQNLRTTLDDAPFFLIRDKHRV